MTEKMPPRRTLNRRGLLWLAAGCLAFGALMVFRMSVQEIWLRAAIAGAAFGVFGIALAQALRGERS